MHHVLLLKACFPLVCVMESESFGKETVALAEKLQLPLVTKSEAMGNNIDNAYYSHVISLSPYSQNGIKSFAIGIQLVQSPSHRKRKVRTSHRTTKPFIIDLCPPPSRNNINQRVNNGSDLLIKAINPRRGKEALVYDLTAGLGGDSLVIARAGLLRVHMVERDPIVGSLLQDALRRLKLQAEAGNNDATSLSERLSLSLEDGLDFLSRHDDDQALLDFSEELPAVVYLDPMFPTRKKKASVKKNMQILHGLLDSQSSDVCRQPEESKLLEHAFRVATERVVVKRPSSADPLGGPHTDLKPSYCTKGPTSRWDVYIK